MSLSEVDNVIDRLADYIAMITEDIQNRSYCQQQKMDNTLPTQKNDFFFLKHVKRASSFHKQWSMCHGFKDLMNI